MAEQDEYKEVTALKNFMLISCTHCCNQQKSTGEVIFCCSPYRMRPHSYGWKCTTSVLLHFCFPKSLERERTLNLIADCFRQQKK